MDEWMVGLNGRQHPGAAGGADCAAWLDRPNERGRPRMDGCSRSLTFTVETDACH